MGHPPTFQVTPNPAAIRIDTSTFETALARSVAPIFIGYRTAVNYDTLLDSMGLADEVSLGGAWSHGGDAWLQHQRPLCLQLAAGKRALPCGAPLHAVAMGMCV